MGEKMNKKKKNSSWFHSVKKFFGLDATSRSDKKERRRRWALERLHNRRKPPPLVAPSQRPSSASVVNVIANPNPNPNPNPNANEEQEENQQQLFQTKNALNVAMATAAAAEAAVAAAQMAAQAFQLTTKLHTPPTKLIHNNNNNTQPPQIQSPSPKLKHPLLNKIQQPESVRINAAITIQSAFRGYLARKALRALKGIVKLQAIIRGKNVRRHAMETMKRLQSIVHIHSQVCSTRSNIAAAERKWDSNDNFQIQQWRDKIKVEKRWDDSLLSKDREDAMVLSRKEAELKRERIRAYSFNHRRSAESESRRPNGRWRYWLEQWVDTQLNKSKEFEDLDSVPTPNPKLLTDQNGWRQRSNLKPQQPPSPLRRQQQYEAPQVESPVIVVGRARQLRHRRQSSMGDDKYSYPSSPSVVPTYMAATESAKAKARSLSSPKTRPGAFDAYSDSYSPYKNKLSLMSTSFVSEVASNTRSYRSTRPATGQQQRSPRLRELHLHAHPALKSEKEAPL